MANFTFKKVLFTRLITLIMCLNFALVSWGQEVNKNAEPDNLPSQELINAKLAKVATIKLQEAADTNKSIKYQKDKSPVQVKEQPEKISISNPEKSEVNDNTATPSKELVDNKLAQIEKQNWQTPLGVYNRSYTPSGGLSVLVTGTEQDCSSALPVCAQSYTQATAYTGKGTVQEISGSCLLGGETNSVWYVFTAQTSGTFGFTLNTTKDYDFALYNITSTGCAGIPTATPVRCNFSATLGNTGMNSASLSTELPALSNAAANPAIMNGISNMVAGQTYALIINNWSADATGYTLTFTGTASITDNIAPTMSAITNNCDKTFTLTVSEQIKCSTIAANGSDFTITGPSAMTISSASGIACTSGNLTTQILISTSGAATAGTYTLHISNGSDGNTVLDKCGNAMSNAQTITFNYLPPIQLASSPSTICTSGTSVTLTATGAPASTANIYSLTPGGLTASSDGTGTATFTVTPTASTTYNLSVTYGGCTQAITESITLITNISVQVDPVNPIICSGNTSLTATSTVNGSPCSLCTYLWNNGSTASSISVPAGSYSVVASYSGCSSNTAASTISYATAGASSTCNIYYVSPAGGGTGLTKASPTDLLTAISLTACTNSIIKMQVGSYNFTNKIDIGSFITIEGGYNASFTTKTSDLTSGGATRIIRSSTPDGGSGTTVTTFNIAGAATGFRLQDLRIEMPVEAAGTQLTNYGIKLGAGCTSYNIVRCYIDAGQGAN